MTHPLTICAWNVNSIRARLANVLAWIEKERPDILLLQELKVETQGFPSIPFEDLGYNLAVHGQKTYNGVAILSRFPIEDISTSLVNPLHPLASEARYIEAFTGGVRVCSVYVINGQSVGSSRYHQKLEFLDALRARMHHLLTLDEAVIVGGDFNVAPLDIDVYDPQSWHEQILCSTPERQHFFALTHLGYKNALTPGTYTWWDYQRGDYPANRGLRIDHLLLSPEASNRMEKAWVDRAPREEDRPSDHAPILVRLKPSSHSF